MRPAGPAAGPRAPVPPGWMVRLAPSTRTAAGGAVLVGGAPLRVVRLSARGARAAGAWRAGAPVTSDLDERRLMRRLLDAGLAQPVPPEAPDLSGITVVVPVQDRPEELRRCLASIPSSCAVVVVDDHSVAPAAVEAAAAAGGARLVCLEGRSGPAAARNRGLAGVLTPLVAFVDSDCVLHPGVLERLAAHLADPAIAAVAPRIVARRELPGLLGRHETHHSALDMGPRGGLVAPGGAIPFVPSATLAARVAALGEGFDETLHVGEDVDLLWRLHGSGWQVRYDPSVTVGHDHRVRAWPWFARRVAYNTSNAPLGRRHPGHVPALVLTPASVLFWALAAAGRPRLALGATAGSALLLHRTLRRRAPKAGALAAHLILRGRLHETRHVGRALTGPWLPLLLAAGFGRAPRLRRRLWAIAGAGALLEWAEERNEPTPLHFLLPRAADDLARFLGVWIGCLRHRTLHPLRVRVR